MNVCDAVQIETCSRTGTEKYDREYRLESRGISQSRIARSWNKSERVIAMFYELCVPGTAFNDFLPFRS